MKITFAVITLCKGGAQRMLVELANGLSQKGYDVAVVMPPQGVIEYPLHVSVIRTKGQSITADEIPVSDVIVSNFYTLTPICEQASHAGKGIHVRISLCYEPVFLPDHEASFKSYHISKNLVVLSNWQQQLIKLNHGIEGSIVPVGVSGNFCNLGKRRSSKRLEVSGIVRIQEGGYSWHREQEYLIETFRALKEKYPRVIFNLISPPNEVISSPTLHQYHSNRSFQSLRPRDDMQLNRFLNKTDIFVSSSTYDTASLPGLEAMKCGAALATVYSGGNMDYCRHGENCLLSYRHENMLFEHVSTLIENAQLRQKLAIEGEKEASKWTWDRSVDLFEVAIKGFMNRR
ncbi:glycosyltransferase family 4 protein [Pseudalkalibacillus salsuginis]|uniref:glycosyltransferase family 4 protein n=1 Tax=Pseudalkalibacillus salsuginis TaxID=2910972 RepID=UPI001F3E29D8|nr:glycosyltransferase family 4 protein [Pseudalkalibacillus salsuginis]MCF6409151.1 glycosyltransferase family 4 protein [Pseudalkalibacillus salsuginis]